jgi:hypothetical protein
MDLVVAQLQQWLAFHGIRPEGITLVLEIPNYDRLSHIKAAVYDDKRFIRADGSIEIDGIPVRLRGV